jgi:hypothetical protein
LVADLLSRDWTLVRSDPRVIAPASGDAAADAAVTLLVAPAEREAPASIRGVALDRTRGEPAQGLVVRGLRGAPYHVDRGAFRATGLAPGELTLVLEAPGYAPRRLPAVDLRPGSEHDYGLIELEPTTRAVVRLATPAGAPVEGGRVRFEPLPAAAGGTGGEGRVRARDEGAGRHVVEHLARGRWRLVVTHPERANQERVVEIEALSEQELEVVLP